MTGQLCSDRLRLIRHGDKNSVSNQKVRKAAFNILLAICRSFFPEPHKFTLFAFGRLPWGFVIADPQSESIAGKPMVVIKRNGCRIMGFIKEGALPSNGMIPLDDAEFKAEQISHGGISKVLDELESLRGREAAMALRKEFGLPSRAES
jgi:hypothetical protein